MSRADLDKQPREVAAMFDGVADGYDRTNTVLSLGLDKLWRKATREALDLRPAQKCLDLAAGTGVSTAELERSGAFVVGADLSTGMLDVAARDRPDLHLVAADALHLPFADASFDAVTISFGLRNIVSVDLALKEMARVTRPGGRLVICEFSAPTVSWARTAYLSYVLRAVPAVARTVASNAEAYVYLAESIREWPAQRPLGDLIKAAGWADVEWRNLTGGIVALHRATRP